MKKEHIEAAVSQALNKGARPYIAYSNGYGCLQVTAVRFAEDDTVATITHEDGTTAVLTSEVTAVTY